MGTNALYYIDLKDGGKAMAYGDQICVDFGKNEYHSSKAVRELVLGDDVKLWKGLTLFDKPMATVASP